MKWMISVLLYSTMLFSMEKVHLQSMALIPTQSISSVVVNSLHFDSYLSDEFTRISSLPESNDEDLPLLIGEALAYPNPMRFSKNEGMIGYRLREDTDITLWVYSMTGQKLYSRDISAGELGGRQGYNTIPFTPEHLQGDVLSVGVYPFLILANGEVLAQGRLGVIP